MLGLLTLEFERHRLVVFDVKFYEKPKQNKIKEWKGYRLEFKVIDFVNYMPEDEDRNRREAHVFHENNSTVFNVDISSFEYTDPKKLVDVEGTVFYVYTPEMIVFEKLRALCQSMPEYQQIVPTARKKGRARDFYDIWNVCQNYPIDFSSKSNKEMLMSIFDAKRVPFDFLKLIEKYRDLQREDWISVADTIPTEHKEKNYDYFFNFVSERIKELQSP